METFFQWLGMAVAWVVVGLTALGMFNWTVEGITKLHDRLISSARFRERQEVGREIATQSHWFSESKEAQTVLQVLGERLIRYPDNRYDAEGVRHLWREKLGK